MQQRPGSGYLGFCTPPFVLADGTPLVAEAQLDGFGKLGLFLLYSDHLGNEALDKFAELFGTDDPNDIVRNQETAHAVVTVPVHDPIERAKLGCGEFAVNTYKYQEEFEALLRENKLEDTGRFVAQGYYESLPVVKLKKAEPVTYREHLVAASCHNCGKLGDPSAPINRCKACHAAWYCGVQCQKQAWKSHHKQLCPILKQHV